MDTDLIEDIEARERNKAYDRRFSECVSYIFDHTSSTWSAARASSPSVLLQLIQIRSRRAYHRAYGEQAMATLLVQQKELFVGGDCVNESIRALLETHAAFRGITANEARARYQSWQEGGWENLVFSSHAAYNSRNAYTQRLHHYSTSLGAAGYHAFSEVKKGFRLLFVVLVNTLSECLHTLQGMQNGAQSKEALVATVHGFLSALAIDYEPQDAQMILDSGLIPLLHGQISMGNRGHERARGPGDGIRTSMWTLYRFIMVLCMGGVRGDSGRSDDASGSEQEYTIDLLGGGPHDPTAGGAERSAEEDTQVISDILSLDNKK